jgi:hypothetical protein
MVGEKIKRHNETSDATLSGDTCDRQQLYMAYYSLSALMLAFMPDVPPEIVIHAFGRGVARHLPYPNGQQ